MIVNICEDTPKLALLLKQPGCNGAQLMDTGVEIRITRKGCPVGPVQEVEEDNCTVTARWVEPSPPAVIYPAFEIDAEGRTVFYFDDKLWNMEPGRYEGEVLIGGYGTGAIIDIDLCNLPLTVAGAAITPVEPCGDLPC
jgi:hypothetical protein